jgi:hypothetical protein
MARGGHGLPKVSLGPTLLCSAGGPPLKQPYGRFRVGPPAGLVACGRLLPFWTPHAVSLFWLNKYEIRQNGFYFLQFERIRGILLNFDAIISVWQGVAMDDLKFHPGPPSPTL